MKGSLVPLWICLVIFLATATPPPAAGGSYLRIARCTMDNGCQSGVPLTQHPVCSPDCTVTPFGIVHPLGYTGAETTIQLRICIEPGSLRLAPALERAIMTWEALTPMAENCRGCKVWGESAGDGSFDAESVLLHELGHCAMGLDHVNRTWDAGGDGVFENTSFTRSLNARVPNGIHAGPDGIPGSRDDAHLDPEGFPADSVAWFRRSDNDPFRQDSTVIDSMTFSRSVSNLPSGHTWGASANRLVGEALGYPLAQAVMYSRGTAHQFFFGLSADDVNMVKMARTGVDRLAGTPDDYVVDLVYTGQCMPYVPPAPPPYDISVGFSSLDPEEVGACSGTGIDYSFMPTHPGLAFHYSVGRLTTLFLPSIALNNSLAWILGDDILADGFEDGTLTDWTLVVMDGLPASPAAETF